MTYTITAIRDDENGTKTTTVEFVYNSETIVVDVPHFRPSSEAEIEVGITNRINSEIQAVEATLKSKNIILEIGVTKEATVLSQTEVADDSTYSTYTVAELNQKLSLLSDEYSSLQSKLVENATDYDLVIAELLKRSN